MLVAELPDGEHARSSRATKFRARLETILTDAKQKFAVGDPRTIEIADAASGTTMETVTK